MIGRLNCFNHRYDNHKLEKSTVNYVSIEKNVIYRKFPARSPMHFK